MSDSIINFYPGPGKIDEYVSMAMQKAINSGILSMNHRSDAFMAMYATAKDRIKDKLQIPEDYQISFVSSATECWQIIALSFTDNHNGSTHIFNGSFGEKWAEIHKLCGKTVNSIPYDPFDLPPIIEKTLGTICITSCETSNGTSWNDESYVELRKTNPDALIAVDATSSMGGIHLPWKSADIWFASVQKCLGLPPGLAVIIYSPNALTKAKEINFKSHYNNFLSIHENSLKNQTTHTPNTLGIYLISEVLHHRQNIQIIALSLKKSMDDYIDFFKKTNNLELYIPNLKVQSSTVICLKSDYQFINKLKTDALKNGILLGNGYGRWSKETVRVANFPAHNKEEKEKLKEFLLCYK